MRRRLLSVVDQGLSSLSNMLLAAFVAHSVSASAFGVFAIVAGIYLFALGCVRSLIGEPLLILRTTLVVSYPDTDGRAAGVAVVLGGVLALPVAAVATALQQPEFLVLAATLPALLWQDGMRYVCFARNRPGTALLSDLAWLGVQVPLGVAALQSGVTSLGLWVGIWGLSALVGAITSTLVLRLRPVITPQKAWLRDLRRTSSQIFADFFVWTGAQQLVIFLLPVVGGLSVLGALKAAQVACGPLNVAMVAAIVVAVPSVAREHSLGNHSLVMRRGIECSGLAVVLGFVFVLGALLAPEPWGELAFGQSWDQGRHLVVFVALQTIAVGIGQGAQVILRGTQNTGRSLMVRIALAPLQVSAPLAGVAIAAGTGLGVSLVVAAGIGAVAWWLTTLRLMKPASTAQVAAI